jgi:omega-6 fatty acid desaturase (delta-12 desaturase)
MHMHAHHPPDPDLGRYWERLLAPYMKPHDGRAVFQVLTTATLYALGWLLMFYTLRWSYLLTLALAVPTVGMLTRLFIFQHDCGHGSFFRSRRANNALGGVLGVLTLTPYRYWRRTHAIHHATSGDLDRRSFGDIETLTVEEYRALSRFGRIKYRLYRHPLTLFVVGPVFQFFIKHRLPLDMPRSWKREWASVHWTNAGLLLGAGLGCWLFGWKAFLAVQIPISLLSGILGIWLFYVQHQFEDTYWRKNPDWSFERAGIEGSSYYDLPRWLHWFTGNIGYHHVHHLASRIPNYRLAECFRKVQELHGVTRLTFWSSLRCARLRLWDETNQRLISFGELRKLERATT